MSFHPSYQYEYGGEKISFSSHHANFMLRKAVYVMQAKTFIKMFDDHPEFEKTKEDIDQIRKCKNRLDMAAAHQWWFDEAEFLADEHSSEVLLASQDVLRDHLACGPTRPCAHRYWWVGGSNRAREKRATPDKANAFIFGSEHQGSDEDSSDSQ